MTLRKYTPAIAVAMWFSIRAASGQACSAANDALPLWKPPADALHGVEEIDHSVRVALPPAVSSITVEIWGGGGGGGRGSSETYSEAGAGGGGGASGSYIRAKVVVTPGAEYTLIIGSGGLGANSRIGASPKKGQDGGDSALCTGGKDLLVAAGGRGGASAAGNGNGGTGGVGRSITLSIAGNPPDLIRPGNDGHTGMLPLFELGGPGGKGGPSVSGTVEPKGSFGGSGGTGEMRPDRAGDGEGGGAGSVTISW